MIKEINVQNFKCFEDFSLPLSFVNIFAGVNGMGKSTIIQSLLLLRQSYFKNGQIDGLYLNGRYIRLGNAQDVLYEKAVEDKIGIGLISDEDQHQFIFSYLPDSDYLPLENMRPIRPQSSLFQNHFSYLSAYRIEPKDLYAITNEEDINNREFGNNGEFALQYLNLHGDEDVRNLSTIIEDKLGTSLYNQTRLWLDKISPGVSPKVIVNTQLRSSEVRYEYIEGKEKTNSYKSINVGFGITYVLPVIVAILSAQAGDIIVVENPEAHIHPAGQRMLGELIARSGEGGVQIIIETHSDHILNGVRLAVKKHLLSKDKVNLSFFYKDEAYDHKVVQPHIMPDGRLDIWPDGFFDEWDKALYELI